MEGAEEEEGEFGKASERRASPAPAASGAPGMSSGGRSLALCGKSANFTRLVLGCIEAKFCN